LCVVKNLKNCSIRRCEISIPNILTTCDYAYGLIEIMDKSGRSKKR